MVLRNNARLDDCSRLDNCPYCLKNDWFCIQMPSACSSHSSLAVEYIVEDIGISSSSGSE